MTTPRELIGLQFPEDEAIDTTIDAISDFEWGPAQGANFIQVGAAFRQAFEKVSSEPEETFTTWQREVHRVASRCLDPKEHLKNRAQLVLGRVQAGKTSNFTGVISLLADNNYELFIVLAGVNLNLRTQTFDRLSKDLRNSRSPGFEVMVSNTKLDHQAEARRIAQRLRDAGPSQDSFADQFRKKLVYVVLKEDDNLRWMNGVIKQVQADFSDSELLSHTPVLIIDDEVDQASVDPYTNVANRVGAIHEEISKMRDLLKTHTYLGYTATPYANLLMAESSRLKCETVTVLSPGPDYVGPEILFGGGAPDFAKEISDWSWVRSEIPASLRKAFGVFVIQAAIINGPRRIQEKFLDEPFLTAAAELTPTSMLVHAHQHVAHASQVFNELTAIHLGWLQALDTPISEDGKRDLAWTNLWKNELFPAASEFDLKEDDIDADFTARILVIIRQMQIREINGPGRAAGFEFPSSNDFESKPAWVLIGGQLLDRGQTLPTLVNTYMPRPPGGQGTSAVRGNVDTIQQRGRFYGQRRHYLRILRGMFDADTLETYKEIATIEPINIEAVKQLDQAGLGIEKLLLVLELGAGSLKAASSNKIPRTTISLTNATWLFRQVHYLDEAQSAANRQLLAGILEESELGLIDSSDIQRKPGYANTIYSLSLDGALALIEGWVRTGGDDTLFATAAALLSSYSGRNHESIDLHMMSRPTKEPFSLDSCGEYRSANRKLVENGSGSSAFVSRITGLTSSNDAKFLRDQRIAIQLHFFDMRVSDGANESIVKNCVGLGVAFPDSRRLAIYDGRSE